MGKLKVGFAPTMRSGFSAEAALRYKQILRSKLEEFDVELVDIESVNENGMLRDEQSAKMTTELFQRKKVDAVFFAHCNFGTEYAEGHVAKALGKPVLLWAPQDDCPDPHIARARDAQCGLFATGKVFRRLHVPFTYVTNCETHHPKLEFGINTFLASARVVKEFRSLKILQIAPRPQAFWSVICNEGELLETFGIELVTLTLSELVSKTKELFRRDAEIAETLASMKGYNLQPLGDKNAGRMLAALNCAIKSFCMQNGCTAVALQCWDAMQQELDLMPCFVNGLLTAEGIPVACETDIHGAISSILMQAAVGGTTFFADMTIRHPHNPNAELLWHCGNFPISLARCPDKAYAGTNSMMPSHCPGTGEFELQQGEVTICRFDGDHGAYSIFIGEGKTVEGPATRGTYVWVEVDNLDRWEYKLVTGPYIHHCSVGYGHVAHVLYEACRYIPHLTPDPINPTEEQILARLMHGNQSGNPN